VSLPELEWQFVYARLAWAVVLAAMVASLLPLAWRRSGALMGGLFLAMAVWAALPGELSVAYWLVLAFQWPSALLAALCVLRLMPPAPVSASLPLQLAAPLAAAGTVLYLDTIGWLSLGLYAAGFGPIAPPLMALAAMAACSACIVAGFQRARALALLVSLALFSIFRLPTGNLWDALLDPLLWAWAVVSLGVFGWRALARRASQLRDVAPEVAAARIEHS
jgi:hypothetical protein